MFPQTPKTAHRAISLKLCAVMDQFSMSIYLRSIHYHFFKSLGKKMKTYKIQVPFYYYIQQTKIMLSNYYTNF